MPLSRCRPTCLSQNTQKLLNFNTTRSLCRNFATTQAQGSFYSNSTFTNRTQSQLSSGKLRPSITLKQLPSSNPSRTMASKASSDPDPAINDILTYWLQDLGLEDWFMNSSQHDKAITSRFQSLVEKARDTNDLDSWQSTPRGSLALIILLDQFPRNIYRPGNHPEPGLSWSGDAKALRIAASSVAKGFDRQIQNEASDPSNPWAGVSHRFFMYMPFMHAEDLNSQVGSCALFELLAREAELRQLRQQAAGETESEQEKAVREWLVSGIDFAGKHRDCVAKLGRFPKRNEPLGREMTEEEKKWLEEKPMGF